MKKLIILACSLIQSVFCMAQTDNDWANHNRYAAQNAAIHASGDYPRVVFMGNSITDFWPQRSADFWRRHPDFCGRGISGQTSTQMLCRFREDVLDLNPRVVVILAGTNDIARNQGFIPTHYVLSNIKCMAELALAHGAKVALCSVTPSSGFSWRKEVQPADSIRELNGLIRRYVEDYASPNLIYIDYHSAMSDEQGGLPQTLSPDNCHPNAAGYSIMEAILMEGIGKWL